MARVTELPRSPRRHLRLNCSLVSAGLTLTGRTENLASTGLHVRFPRLDAAAAGLEIGREVSLALTLPDRPERLQVRAELARVTVDEVDVGGARACGLGLRILSPEIQQLLERFLKEFRYTLV